MILILLFNGNLEKERLDFNSPVTVRDCWAYGETHREAIATHVWDIEGDRMKMGWYLNDGRGTLQGFYCE